MLRLATSAYRCALERGWAGRADGASEDSWHAGACGAAIQFGFQAGDTDRLREHIAELLLQAAEFVSPARVEETARGWLSLAVAVDDDPGREVLRVADALGMATDLALFTPSVSGMTAFDRLARRLGRVDPEQAAALDALRRAQFRLLWVEAPSSDGVGPAA